MEKMRPLTGRDVLCKLCEATKKWGMFFQISTERQEREYVQETVRAAPWLDSVWCIIHREGYLLFDTYDELMDVFNRTCGDEGATALNPYDGVGNVYAVICSPDGRIEQENT